jgi:hypothetical protein
VGSAVSLSVSHHCHRVWEDEHLLVCFTKWERMHMGPVEHFYLDDYYPKVHAQGRAG